MKRGLLSGWCETQYHQRCKHVLREERTTPKGVHQPGILCACKCHPKKEEQA